VDSRFSDEFETPHAFMAVESSVVLLIQCVAEPAMICVVIRLSLERSWNDDGSLRDFSDGGSAALPNVLLCSSN
jgi:hypothetical protein